MKATEYIKALEALVALHGDLDVEKDSPYFGRHVSPHPELGFRAVLLGRESKPRFWCKYSSKAAINKGEEVIKV